VTSSADPILPTHPAIGNANDVAAMLTSAAGRLRAAVGGSGSKLTVADRAAMLAAWAALDTSSKLGELWRQQNVAPSSDLQAAVTKVAGDVDALLSPDGATAVAATAAQVYSDASAAASQLGVASPKPGVWTLPAVTAATCASTASSTISDLGSIATSELTYQTTRAGYPWIAVSPSAAGNAASFGRYVKPSWARAPAAPSAAALATSRTLLASHFAHNAARTATATATFDEALHAGFDREAATMLAEQGLAPADLAPLRQVIATQASAATPNATAQQTEIAQVGALADGIRSGARARQQALAQGKPPGVVANVAATLTPADHALATTRRTLEACAMLPAVDTTKASVVTALSFITSYGTLSATCSSNSDCEGGESCFNGECRVTCGCGSEGETCSPTPSGGACTYAQSCIAGSCPNGFVCKNNECLASCGAQTCTDQQKCTSSCVARGSCSACAETQYCDDSAVVPSCREEATRECMNDADCVGLNGGPSAPGQSVPHCVLVANGPSQPSVHMCIGIGWACRQPGDCATGTECDMTTGQCVDRDSFNCTTANPCRASERCILENGTTPRCDVGSQTAGKPCDATVNDGHMVYGACNAGTWTDNGHGALTCKPAAKKDESCNSIDDDCDGVIDDNLHVSPCTADGARGECRNGTSACVNGAMICNASLPTGEICDGKDNNCDNVADNIVADPCPAAATGECHNGTKTCQGGQEICQPAAPQAEVCDSRDNNCDGAVDNLGTTQEVTREDGAYTASGAFGTSENHLYGDATCGGVRGAANARQMGGGGGCGVVDWANDACTDPGRRIGNSDLRDACKQYTSSGGQVGAGGASDCRYIVHFGAAMGTFVSCQMNHTVTIPQTCQ
jgi:hypothetical protein